MKKDGDDDDVRDPEMDPANERAERGLSLDELDRRADLLGQRSIELREPKTGQREHDEADEADTAERVRKAVGVPGDRIRERREPRALIDPPPHPLPDSTVARGRRGGWGCYLVRSFRHKSQGSAQARPLSYYDGKSAVKKVDRRRRWGTSSSVWNDLLQAMQKNPSLIKQMRRR